MGSNKALASRYGPLGHIPEKGFFLKRGFFVMAKEELFIGLDVGTDSVGWAATNQYFDLQRIKGKTAWGSRIFDAAEDAETRRNKRSARRRSERRKYRIFLLDEIFADEINKIDDTFFLRLHSSTFIDSDKDAKIRGLNLLFKDKEIEKNYFKKYPTIWHLRKELLNEESDAYQDIRNVYLALHHILKYRGNFLNDGKIETNNFDFDIFDELNKAFNDILSRKVEEDEFEEFTFIRNENYERFCNVLDNKEFNKTQKKKELGNLTNSNSSIGKYLECFITLTIGGSFDISKLDESYEKISISFEKNYDENEEKIYTELLDDSSIIKIAKRIYDHFKLKDLLGNHKYLSDAFVSIYVSHKQQLASLKNFCKKVDNDFSYVGNDSLYKKVFKNKTSNNYSAFVGVDSDISKISIEEFNKEISKIFDEYKEEVNSSPDFKKLCYLSNRQELLMTIASASSSLIPHQLHENELDIILKNASKYYPFIKGSCEKIKQIFKFRVPYYFGPLDSNSKYSNAVRIKNERVTPWNFNDIFDIEKTRSKFMANLTNNCSYLLGESVLPINSICYQRFVILNKLNTLTINGQRIDNDLKKILYEQILCKKKTTFNGLLNLLKKELKIKDVSVSGLNQEDYFVSDSYCIFNDFFNTNKMNYEQEYIAEKIIYICAIYKDNISDSFNLIEKELKSKLDKKQINLLKSKNFGGWGRLSKKLIKELKIVLDSGVCLSILDVLEQTTLNFNQIINKSSGYDFEAKIEEENKKTIGEKTKEDTVNEIIESVPSKFRRSIIQSTRIIDEIVKLKGCEPKYISIEVTRENVDGKKNKQTVSRYKELNQFIKSIIKDSKNQYFSEQGKSVLINLQEFENEQSKLKSRHLYLYFKQNGLDLYTGKPIDINDVLNSNKYDIDHIVPRHLRPDDSLDNMALVERTYNQKIKGGLYPLPESIRCNKEIRNLWDYLHRIGSISDKKYNSLIRATEISEEELADFVNSQINVVNQSNVTLKNILNILYPNTKIIFSKAQYPSYLRQHYRIEKLRELNDTHHAVDAYLNIVSGVTLYKEYSKDYIYNNHNPITNEDGPNTRTFNMEKRLVRILDETNLDDKIINSALKHDPIVTYRQQYFDAEFYKETIHKKGRDTLIPTHTNGPLSNQLLYGGYEELKTSYFLVGSIHGNKPKKVLLDVPVLYSKLYTNINDLKDKIIKDQLPEVDVKEIDIDFKHPIQPNQKIILNHVPYLLCSKGSMANLKLAYQLYLDKESISYLAFLSNNEERVEILKDYEGDEFSFALNRENKNSFIVSRSKNKKIMEEIFQKSNQAIFDDCNIVQTIKSIDGFDQSSLYEQVNIIFEAIKLFGRNARYSSFKPNLYTKSKQSLLKDEVILVYESITGLCSYRRKL